MIMKTRRNTFALLAFTLLSNPQSIAVADDSLSARSLEGMYDPTYLKRLEYHYVEKTEPSQRTESMRTTTRDSIDRNRLTNLNHETYLDPAYLRTITPNLP